MNEDTRLVFLIGRTGRTGGILDHFHNLFDDLRMQDRVAMKRNCHPEIVFSVYTVATFGPKMLKACTKKRAFRIASGPTRRLRHSLRRR